MPAGLPGTGVGGLFLILSALLMPVVELRRRMRGRTGLGGWRLVGRNTALAIGIVVVVAGGVWALHSGLLGSSPTHGGASARSAGANLLGGLVPTPVATVLMTFALLAGIIIIAYTLRLVRHGPGSPRMTLAPSDISSDACCGSTIQSAHLEGKWAHADESTRTSTDLASTRT